MEACITFTVNGIAYEAHIQPNCDFASRSPWDRRPIPRARAYVWTAPNVLADLESRVTGARYAKERRAEERRLLVAAFEAMGVAGARPGTWSRKMGCSCGCSPGFVVEGLPAAHELFVSVVKEKPVPEPAIVMMVSDPAEA